MTRGAAAFGALRMLPGCPKQGTRAAAPLTGFAAVRERYFLGTLERNPVLSTYLGGDGYAPKLRERNRALRDFRPDALQGEIAWLESIRAELARFPAATLATGDRIDHGVIDAQARFLLHMLKDRRYQQRAVDTYTNEPFRGVDWQIQQMTPEGGGIGTELEWDDVVARVGAVPAFLRGAQEQLRAGVAANNVPDKRLVLIDGIKASNDAAAYFTKELPALAAKHTAGRPFSESLARRLDAVGRAAGFAFEAFRGLLERSYDLGEQADRYILGEDEYAWRLKHCLLDTRSPAELWEYGASEVARYQTMLFAVAEEVAKDAKLGLPFGSESERRASVRAVLAHLEKDAPRDDDELFRWYRECGDRCVEWGRERGMFDVPADYRLDVLPLPAILHGSGGASYYPAPAFKRGGVGRFYLEPTGNDPALLAANNRATIADTAVHEGFPGHDWHYKFMTQHAREISPVRWLSVGAVEDSFSMWADSMAAEGWGLYAEDLMAEPAPGRPHGFYDAAEHLVELQWQIVRAVRVRVDVGLHTGRMTIDQAIDYLAESASFYPGACANAADDPAAGAVCGAASDQIFRYSKWPTQAVTYNLGQAAIVELREAERKRKGAAFSAKEFHERFMKMGTIPAAYFRDVF